MFTRRSWVLEEGEMQSTTVLVLVTILSLYYINTQLIDDVNYSRWDFLEFQHVQYKGNELDHLKKKVMQQQTIEAQALSFSIFHSKEVVKSPIKSIPVTPIQSERQSTSLHSLQVEQDSPIKVIPHPNPPDPLPKAISLESGNYTLKDFGTASINRRICKLSITNRIWLPQHHLSHPFWPVVQQQEHAIRWFR